uniref:G-protein coupled receptors family 1 profile domain-containing protein n=1 Tax=Ditylenchus dipsaci TaxID=166011 RepID=A0A915D4A5_9BILA
MVIIISGNNCWNKTTHPDGLQKELEEHDHVFRIYYGYMALPVVLPGFISTTLLIMCIIKAMKERRVGRKFYALLLNRAIGDLLAILCAAATIVFVFCGKHVSDSIVHILNTLFIGCFWSAMVSYVFMGLLKLYGIARPLHYLHHITMKKCVKIIVLSWLVFFILVTVTMILIALTKISVLADWTNCTMEICLKPIYRLALNVGTLAIFHFPYTLWAIFLTFAPTCFFTFHWTVMQTLMGYVRFFLLFRILLDSCMGILLDKEMKISLQQLLGLTKKTSSRTNWMISSTNNGALKNGHIAVASKKELFRAASVWISPKLKVWPSSDSSSTSLGSTRSSPDTIEVASFGSIKCKT